MCVEGSHPTHWRLAGTWPLVSATALGAAPSACGAIQSDRCTGLVLLASLQTISITSLHVQCQTLPDFHSHAPGDEQPFQSSIRSKH